MDFSIGTITGYMIQAFSALFGFAGLSSETGNGLLKFVEFFGMIGDWIVNLFTRLFSGLIG